MLEEKQSITLNPCYVCSDSFLFDYQTAFNVRLYHSSFYSSRFIVITIGPRKHDHIHNLYLFTCLTMGHQARLLARMLPSARRPSMKSDSTSWGNAAAQASPAVCHRSYEINSDHASRTKFVHCHLRHSIDISTWLERLWQAKNRLHSLPTRPRTVKSLLDRGDQAFAAYIANWPNSVQAHKP